jgi:transposase
MTDTDDVCGEPTADGDPCQHPPTESDGRCWHHTEIDEDRMEAGRPSTFEDHRDDLLEAAREPIKTRDVARTAGVGKSTLYDWLDAHPEFSDAFKRARSEAARELVARGLDDPDVDTGMIRFLLERTFDYTKTQELEVGGDGLVINVPDDAAEY